jgi:hypothetical protein
MRCGVGHPSTSTRGLTQPACNLRATLVGDGQREGYPCRGEWRVSRGRGVSIRPPVQSVTWLRRCAGPRTAQTHPVCPVWTRSVSGKGCKGGRVVCVTRPRDGDLELAVGPGSVKVGLGPGLKPPLWSFWVPPVDQGGRSGPPGRWELGGVRCRRCSAGCPSASTRG